MRLLGAFSFFLLFLFSCENNRDISSASLGGDTLRDSKVQRKENAPPKRPLIVKNLKSTNYDLLIIGGGASGCGRGFIFPKAF